MEAFDRVLGLSHKNVIFRPIEFELYRRPQVTPYPRHAVVLNPHHTREQQLAQLQKREAGSSSGDEDDDDDDGKAKRRKKDAEDEDDDDPSYLEQGDMLCNDKALRQYMHLRWRSVGPVGIGLVNLGNTCFANSVLQCIAYTPALAQYFAESFRTADQQVGAPYDFAFALGECVRQIHLHSPQQSSNNSSGRGGSGAYRPANVVGRLKALSPHLQLGRQCDAHEFALNLLFGCQKSILYRLMGPKKILPRVAHTTPLYRICGGYLQSQVSWSLDEELQQLQRAGKRQEAVDLRMVWENKQAHQQSAGGGNKRLLHSNTYDPFTILNVELAGHTLYHCLDKFCEAEKLEGRIYSTPRSVSVHATKQFRIHMPPPVLVIQVKRFTHTGSKAGKYIQYPKLLDIAKYCTPNGKLGHTTVYELDAITVHEGSTLGFGHYYAVVRARNKMWYECNDSHVSIIGEEKALRQQAYMLFYSRVDTEHGHEKKSKKAAVATTTATQPKREEKVAKATASSSPAMGPVSDMGEELDEAEVARRLRERKAQLKRQRDDSEEEEEKPKQPGTATSEDEEQAEEEAEEDYGNEEDGEEETPTTPQQHPSVASKLGRYGGLVKAMRRHDKTAPAPGAKQGQQAVYAFRHHKQSTLPSTVARPADAPKFQQKVRDIMWEKEMDKGRVKKVKKERPDTHGQGNLFQNASEHRKFDLRGRRERD